MSVWVRVRLALLSNEEPVISGRRGGDRMHPKEIKDDGNEREPTRRVFGVVLKGSPNDFQMWLDSAKTYGLYIIFSKSTRIGRLVMKEESW